MNERATLIVLATLGWIIIARKAYCKLWWDSPSASRQQWGCLFDVLILNPLFLLGFVFLLALAIQAPP